MQHIPKSSFEWQPVAAKSRPAKSQPAKYQPAKSQPASHQRQLQVPAGQSQRKLAPIDRPNASSLTWPQQLEPHTSTKGNWLFATIAFGALAGLGLTAGVSTMFILVGVLGVTLSFLVACLVWAMDNVPFS